MGCQLRAIGRGPSSCFEWAQWCAVLEASDACLAPVLSVEETHEHPHHLHRQTSPKIAGVLQPAPAPRFSRTVPAVPAPPAKPGQHTDEALLDWGLSAAGIAALRTEGAIR